MSERRRLLLFVALLGAACSHAGGGEPAAHDDPGAQPDSGVVVEATPAAAVAFDPEPGALRSVLSEPVHGRTGPGDVPFEIALRTADAQTAHARRFGVHTLQVQLRRTQPALVNYPCTSCHAGRTVIMADERIRDAHSSIAVTHPRETGATCATCHSADDVQMLALRTGERASLDHAYRVCAQCHVAQVDAWAAGAHGKRLDGWRGRRVVMGCADCHDPHAPALVSRLPFRPPRLRRPGSHQP